MKRDTLKTLAGLLIIGVIVVATFMYGNAQRQAQIKRDQAAKKQQEAKANNAGKALPSASASPAAQPTTGGTAAVKSPSSNTVQGGTQVTAAPKATENGQVAGASTPAPASATPAPPANSSNLPQTGPETAGALGAMAVLGSMFMLRRSKKNLYHAVRSPRM
jgi:LPXTG-motif cell wall-anchored protein